MAALGLGAGMAFTGAFLYAISGSGAVDSLERKVEALLGDWVGTLLKKTMSHEGTFYSVQRNKDGQGVSYGILQWTQKGGGLAKVLRAMYAADPAKFAEVFEGGWQRMLAAVDARSLEAVDGAYLWDEPWLSRFYKAGRIRVFQQAQMRLAASSEYMQAAKEIAKILGPRSERAMVVYFNRTVHQGAQGALVPAKRLAAGWQSGAIKRPNNDRDILLQYTWLCAGIFRRVTPPKGDGWRQVSTEYPELKPGDRTPAKTAKVPVQQPTWHKFAGDWSISLYDLIVFRTRDILNDPQLRDQPVDFNVA